MSISPHASCLTLGLALCLGGAWPSIAHGQDVYKVEVDVQEDEFYPIPGQTWTLPAIVSHVGSVDGYYMARVKKSKGPGAFAYAPSTTSFVLGPGESISLDFAVTANAANDARNSSRLKVQVLAEVFYDDTQDVCIVPSSVTTTPTGFVGHISQWSLVLEPTSTNFEGRFVTELAVPGSDGCFTLLLPPVGHACMEKSENSGLSVGVLGGNLLVDLIGYSLDCADVYVDALLADPFSAQCRANWPQPRKILHELRDASRIRIEVVRRRGVDALAVADIVVDILPDSAPGHVARRLGKVTQGVLACSGHPFADDPSLEACCRNSHVLVSTADLRASAVDRALAALGRCLSTSYSVLLP